MDIEIDFLPTMPADWVCDFGDEDGCTGQVHWVTHSGEWVVPMFACNIHKAQFETMGLAK